MAGCIITALFEEIVGDFNMVLALLECFKFSYCVVTHYTDTKFVNCCPSLLKLPFFFIGLVNSTV
jgi:hypothetical protein